MFEPIFNKDFKLTIVSEERDGLSVYEQLDKLFCSPFWPVGTNIFTSYTIYKTIKNKESLIIGDIKVETEYSSHPNTCTHFKITSENKSFIYALDFEHTNEGYQRLKTFATGADTIVYDAHYTKEEYTKCEGFGHSTWQVGAQLAKEAGIKKIIFSHHAPNRTDAELIVMEKEAKLIFPNSYFAKEI